MTGNGDPSRRGLRRAVDYIADQLETPDDDDDRLTADDHFDIIGQPGGALRLLHEDVPTLHRATIGEILNRHESRSVTTYGVDASLTTPIRVLSDYGSHVTNIATAGADTVGGDPIHTRPITTGGVVAHAGGDAPLEPTTVREGALHMRIASVSDLLRSGQQDKLTTDYSRAIAEGIHLQRLAPQADGPVFIDGPLFPTSSVMKDFAFIRARALADAAAETDADTTVDDQPLAGSVGGDGTMAEEVEEALAETWATLAGEAMANYLQALDTLLEGGHAPIGIVKHPKASILLSDIEEKAAGSLRLPWDRDTDLISALASRETARRDEIAYTSWIAERAIRSGVDGGHELAVAAGLDTTHDSDAFRRAYMFVTGPIISDGAVFRIEAPVEVISDPDRATRVRQLVLAELVRSGDVPEAILCADRRMRISRSERREIFSEAGLDSMTNYDRDYRDRSGGEGGD